MNKKKIISKANEGYVGVDIFTVPESIGTRTCVFPIQCVGGGIRRGERYWFHSLLNISNPYLYNIDSCTSSSASS